MALLPSQLPAAFPFLVVANFVFLLVPRPLSGSLERVLGLLAPLLFFLTLFQYLPVVWPHDYPVDQVLLSNLIPILHRRKQRLEFGWLIQGQVVRFQDKMPLCFRVHLSALDSRIPANPQEGTCIHRRNEFSRELK